MLSFAPMVRGLTRIRVEGALLAQRRTAILPPMTGTAELGVGDSRGCPSCGAVFPEANLSCPHCHRLVHADRLKQLQSEAQRHATMGDREAELIAWREVLALIPDGTRQAQQVRDKLAALTAAAPAKSKTLDGRALASLGALGLLLWKFKAVIAFALTKGKLLLLGFSKMSTVLSMLLSVGVYWTIWGWQFAVGLVLSIYVHEMGHVAALRRLGIAATAPMFVPGLGAFIRAKQYPATPSEDAQVGLAGPIYGLGAALFCWAVSITWDAPLFAAIARIGGAINLFNLLPIWSLDGGRGVRAMSRNQRLLACAAIGGAMLVSGEPLLILLLLALGARALFEKAPEQGDLRALITYAALIAALSWLATLTVRTDLPS